MLPVIISSLGAAVGSALLGMLVKTLTKGAVEKLVLIGLRSLVSHTESEVDDEVYAVVKNAVEGPAESDLPSDVQ